MEKILPFSILMISIPELNEHSHQHRNFLISSWMIMESDRPLTYAIHAYRAIYDRLYDMNIQPWIVFSGGKSLHFYFPIDFYQYLTPKLKWIHDSTTTLDLKKQLWLERMARKQFYENYLQVGKLEQLLDDRVKYDMLRQIPVPYTFNGYTRKFVTPITRDYLYVDPSEIVRKSTIEPWRLEYHQRMDKMIEENVQSMMNIYNQQ